MRDIHQDYWYEDGRLGIDLSASQGAKKLRSPIYTPAAPFTDEEKQLYKLWDQLHKTKNYDLTSEMIPLFVKLNDQQKQCFIGSLIYGIRTFPNNSYTDKKVLQLLQPSALSANPPRNPLKDILPHHRKAINAIVKHLQQHTSIQIRDAMSLMMKPLGEPSKNMPWRVIQGCLHRKILKQEGRILYLGENS
jgi:hypothetical protein